MLSWRCPGSSTRRGYYAPRAELQPPAVPLGAGRIRHGHRGRDGRLPPDPGRGLDVVALPHRRHDHADRTGHEAGGRGRAALHDRSCCSPAWQSSCYVAGADRGGDRRRRPDRKMGRAETEAGHRAAARSLHHLRLRPRRPASRRGAAPRPGATYVVRRLQRPEVLAEARARSDHVVEGSGTRRRGSRRAPASSGRRGSWRRRTRTSTTSTSRSRRARSSPTCSSSRAPPTSTPARSSGCAGADRVVQPYSTAGKEMANLVLKPQVATFLELVSTQRRPRLPLRGDPRRRRVAQGCGRDDP